MKNHLLLAVMMLLPMVASADALEINGIWYNLTDETKQAEVTEAPSNYGNYSGSVVIPEKITYGSDEYSVTSIGIRAFSGCSGLTSIIIPNSVTKIMHWAFENCSGLTSVTIPNTVTEISQGTFRNCSSLTSITIHNTVKKIGQSAFSGCSGLTSITIPNSVTNIGIGAFNGCSGLTSVTIPNSVTDLGAMAFNGMDLQFVVSLIANPFEICGNKYGYSRSFSENTFNNATLYVPVGAKEKYQATDGWKDFAHIEEGNPTGIKVVENTSNNNITIYDLNGVRQSEPRKGINIISGKKVIVK